MMVEGSDEIFDVSVVDFIDIIKYDVGQAVTMEYREGEKTNVVLSLNGEEKNPIEEETEETDNNSGTALQEE